MIVAGKADQSKVVLRILEASAVSQTDKNGDVFDHWSRQVAEFILCRR